MSRSVMVIALLGSVALHRYHSKAKYECSRDGVPVNGESSIIVVILESILPVLSLW